MVPRPFLSRGVVVAFLLHLIAPSSAHTEGSLSYKFQSWQEDGNRIRVDSHSAQAEQSLPQSIKLKLSGVIDSIAGATPSGQPADSTGQVPLSKMEDRRKAWQAEASRPFGNLTVSLGGANSRESDYVSNGWSVNTLTEMNQKNTTLMLGVAGTSDKVRVFYQPEWAKKNSFDLITGVTQLINPETSVVANIGFGRATGYMSDPYKIIQKTVELGPGLFLPITFIENRPDRREKWTLYLGGNHAYKTLGGAVDLSYRFYHDGYGINSHTVSANWIQALGDRFYLQPSARWYLQSAADFYRVTLDGTSIQPGTRPNPSGPFYSADYRLSHMRTTALGLKLLWKVVPERIDLDVEYQHYGMTGLDHITSASAYIDANVFTAGAHVSW